MATTGDDKANPGGVQRGPVLWVASSTLLVIALGVGVAWELMRTHARVPSATRIAGRFAEYDVSWFEEPVSSVDLDGLRLLRDRAPMEVAAGEYGYEPSYFARMVGAVDVQQADATRCGGITGLLAVSALCDAHQVPFSAHCAPQLHAHAACAIAPLRHLEYFHDHARIERMLFDGALEPDGGALRPDPDRPGLGVELKAADAERWAA